MTRRLAYAVIILAVLAPATVALAGDYSSGGAFTAPAYGARQWGMAGAAVARGADEGSVDWNPALLSLIKQNRVGFSYIDLIEGADAKQTYFAWAQILKRGQTDEPGLEFNVHTVGLVFSNLGITLADGQSYDENVLRLAYTWAPRYFFSIGASFGVFFSDTAVPGFGGDGTALDVGGRLSILRGTTVALAVRNAMSRVDYEDGLNISLDRVVTLGVAHDHHGWLGVEGDLVIAHSGFSRVAVGAEAMLFERLLQLRGGLAAFNTGAARTVPYAGLGIEFSKFRLDYNANLDTEDAFGKTHRFSLGIGF